MEQGFSYCLGLDREAVDSEILEQSIIENRSISRCFFENDLEFLEVPECSISIMIFGHDQGQNVQEEDNDLQLFFSIILPVDTFLIRKFDIFRIIEILLLSQSKPWPNPE
jgi:hypothetical protein